MARRARIARRQAQAGTIGLTDAILGIAVTAVVMPTVIALTNQQTRETQDEVAAQQLKAVGEATQAYVKDHFVSLYDGIYNGSFAGDFMQIADLAGTGYLPANFSAQNAYKQTFAVLLRIVADTSTSCPTPNLNQLPDGVKCKPLLEAVVVTTGGTVLDPAHASHVAVLAGAHAGIVADAGTVRGAYGTWCEDLTLFGGATASGTCPRDNRPNRSNALSSPLYAMARPGQGGVAMGMFFNGGDLMSEYLDRFNTGNPEDNTMHTGIDMSVNPIGNVSTVQIAGIDPSISGADQGLEATRMNMINNLFNGTYAANDGSLTVTKDLLLGDLNGQSVSKGVYSVDNYAPGSFVPAPACPSGMSPAIYNLPAQIGDNGAGYPVSAIQPITTAAAGGWTVALRVLTQNGWQNVVAPYGYNLVMTKCS